MKKFSLSTTHIILLSFVAVILIGTLLLMLPISSADGRSTPFVDALFTATTSTCVTGLVVVPTVSSWSIFGQVVILLLIQIGGLGVITVMTGFALFLHRRIGLSDRMLIQDAFNLSSMSGLVKFVKKAIIGTLLAELAGALLYMTVFVREFGAKGIWISLFNSVSAFCNAGIDIIAENSLCNYATNPIINIVTSLLIIAGGIGFIVWWDIARVARLVKTQRLRAFKSFTLHTKIVLSVTAILIFGGGILFFVFEYNNPATIGNMSLSQKVMASLFQSVTTRTAGFASIPQEALTTPSVLTSLVLMFIGGSPSGTAGGIKTVTLAVIAASAYASVKNKSETSLFGRNISSQTVSKALAVTATSFAIMLVSSLLLAGFTNAPLSDILYETVSATATVGLSRNFTPLLNTAGKIIVALNMYFGRVGPISLAVAFSSKKKSINIVNNPTEEISVG